MKTSLLLFAALLAASAAFGFLRVEADLDGVVGNGTDYIMLEPGDVFDADLWILGDVPPAWVAGMILCNYNHCLDYLGCTYYSPGGSWAFVPPAPPDPLNCLTVQGQNLSFDLPMAWPWRMATVTYRCAVDCSISEIFMEETSGVLTTGFSTILFDNDGEVIARIQCQEGDAVEPTSWGSVKALFR